MNIRAEKIEIEMNHNECWTVAWNLKNHFLHIVKTHWVYHQQSWKGSTESERALIRNFFYGLGVPCYYDSLEEEVLKIFQEFEANKIKTP